MTKEQDYRAGRRAKAIIELGKNVVYIVRHAISSDNKNRIFWKIIIMQLQPMVNTCPHSLVRYSTLNPDDTRKEETPTQNYCIQEVFSAIADNVAFVIVEQRNFTIPLSLHTPPSFFSTPGNRGHAQRRTYIRFHTRWWMYRFRIHIFCVTVQTWFLERREFEKFGKCWRIRWHICYRDIWETMLEGSTKKPSRSVSGKVVDFLSLIFAPPFYLLLFTEPCRKVN